MVAILLVEDDRAIRAAVLRELAHRGHVVEAVATGMAGLAAALAGDHEVVVLDLGLPDVRGKQVLEMLRGTSDIPVIVATAQSDEPTMVALLNAGADDFITKPFSVTQLEARIRAVLRRTKADEPPDRMVIGDLVIDVTAHTATLDGTRVELSRLEFALLAHLASREGQVVGKRELLAEVWHQPMGGSDRTVDVHLSWLRRKLGESADDPRFLHTVRGVGVRLQAPVP